MNLRAQPGFARTLVAGFIGSSLLTDGAADVADGNHFGWLWLAFGAFALWLLTQHLREQAVRGLNRPDTTWTRTDTANVSILAVLITLMIVGTFADPEGPAAEAATYTVAATYLALLTDFTIQRRQTVKTAPTNANQAA
ncbi:hypothetical protein M1L60_29770 [Actinoplanes sp. TRM 88003]|uniref:Uncharacterized protein n=1 Tax=Paractinoplanes aksuensis TaxID=2939490 RepID=A0ABT1DVE8_9ACTN|nr:hypothetical protein [Actinoplanes aksuensis]MCO8274792.1 hypothetical protein [Actinoplanes aksuensis]